MTSRVQLVAPAPTTSRRAAGRFLRAHGHGFPTNRRGRVRGDRCRFQNSGAPLESAAATRACAPTCAVLESPTPVSCFDSCIRPPSHVGGGCLEDRLLGCRIPVCRRQFICCPAPFIAIDIPV